MSQTERLYRLKSFLDTGRCLTRQFLSEEFGTSPATVKRDIARMRDRMNAPVVFDRERGGWRFDRQAATIGTPACSNLRCSRVDVEPPRVALHHASAASSSSRAAG